MDDSRERWAHRILSGEDRSAGASILRGGLTIAEPFFTLAVWLRNRAYDMGLSASHELVRPTISVGNLTTGGTGKTPIVRWLCECLISRGLRPSVLLRGYRGQETGESDEQRMLADALGGAAIVVAKPNRRAGAMTAMREINQPDVFVLDDGFQHRGVKRDLDLVLIDATEPFGFGRVLPRGLLREPISGLRRADAIVITRSDQATAQQLQTIEAAIRRYQPAAFIYFARHVLTAPIEELRSKRFFAFAGIANPTSLQQQLEGFGRCVGFTAFRDHHGYTAADLANLRERAAVANAEILVTTEKDWVKIRALPEVAQGMPILPLEMRIEFRDPDEERLLDQVLAKIKIPQAGLRRA